MHDFEKCQKRRSILQEIKISRYQNVIIREDIRFISPYNINDNENQYAVRFMLKENLRDVWDDDNHTSLEITVYCENESSGVGKVFKKIIYQKSSIIMGKFKTGKSMEIERITM